MYQIGLHGAPLIYGLMMRPGAALVEIRPHGFEGVHLVVLCSGGDISIAGRVGHFCDSWGANMHFSRK